MVIQVPIYSEQPMTQDAFDIIKGVIDQYPPNTFRIHNLDPKNYASFSGIHEPRVLIFGTIVDPMGRIALNAIQTGSQLVHTYSLAQICTKANAVSVLKAALNQFYLPQKVHPTRVIQGGLDRFDLDKPIAVDIETAGDLDKKHTPEQVDILSISFYQEGMWACWDFRTPLEMAAVKQWLRKIKYPIWHNGKFDIRVIEARTGVRMPNFFDTMLAHHVLNQAAGLHKLKPLCRMYLGAPEWEADLSKWTVGGAYYENVPAHILNEYNMWDVYWTYELWKYLEPLIFADDEAQKAFLLEMKAADFLLDVEQFGFAIDVPYTQNLENDMAFEVDDLLSKLQTLTSGVVFKTNKLFNPGSWQQVQTVLTSFSGTAYTDSTDEKHLTKYRANFSSTHPVVVFIDLLLEYRGVSKALSTYVTGALNKARKGRVHTTFLVHGTSTGRLSSSGPNIQNIPRDAKFRSIYIG